jgi:hypothetical protein
MDLLNVNRKTIIEILSAVLRNSKPILLCDGNIDWQAVADEAGKHKIVPLVYYFLMQNADVRVPDAIKEGLRKLSLIEIAEQEKNYLTFGELLGKLKDSNIAVIVLKGLFLRNLYHEPWLRSMNDYDVLVRPEDLEKVAAIMSDAGYKMVHSEEKHAAYVHPHYIEVEFHKSLIASNRYENLSEFEKAVWKRVIPVKVGKVDVLTLDPTDHAVHLVLHMATHIKGGGFGLRQLCDWVLFIEAYNKEIDWDVFAKYIKSMGMKRFTWALFEVCNKLFGLDVPQEWSGKDKSMHEVTDRLILDIFDSGIFGNDDSDRITANRMIYYNEGTEAKTLSQRILNMLNLFFPKAEKLDVRYGYAKRYRFLLPIAWIHRFIHTIVRRDINIFEKTVIFKPKKAAEIYSKRSLLLQQLGLLKK